MIQLHKPLDCGDGTKAGMAITAARKASLEGRHVALYFDPQHGWSGWQTTGQIEGHPMDRLLVLRDDRGNCVRVTESSVRTAFSILQRGMPDAY